jgi:hypothetical protein
LLALCVFAAVIGGWSGWQRYAQSNAILPDAGGRQGACVLWFVGSSTVHRWTTLAGDMRPWIVHRRGIDGATFDEIRHAFSNERGMRRPQAIILYAGENDIAFGGDADGAIADLRAFLKVKTDRLGDVPVFVVSLKPSPARWRYLGEQRAFNTAARAIAARRRDVHYVDVVPLMLVNGRPGAFYMPDGIHMNAAGYLRWSGAIHEALGLALPPGVVRNCAPEA